MKPIKGSIEQRSTHHVTDIPEGHAMCPTCRRVVRLRPSGTSLRKHRDLFNRDCWNNAVKA